MSKKTDITLNFPAEYTDALLEIFTKGLRHARLKPEVRQALRAWWEVERQLVIEEIDHSNE